MWNRDLNLASDEGHVDFPRLREAGVKLQCFTVVTRGFPFIDGFPLFMARRKWPLHARRGEWARCLWQLDRLAGFCRDSEGKASIAATARQLEDNLTAQRLSAVLGIEGAHVIEGDPARIAQLHERGVRFVGLTHLHNNELGGSSFPFMGNKGLTPLGHQTLDAMAGSKMILDVAHASLKTLDDMLARSDQRLFCSHTGVSGVTPSWRNIPDHALKTIADRGGVVGIIFATYYVGGKQLDDVLRHIEHAINVMGEDAVGFGSDYDGMVPLPVGMRDVRDLPKLTHAMLKRGWSEGRVEKVIGENLRRYFREQL